MSDRQDGNVRQQIGEILGTVRAVAERQHEYRQEITELRKEQRDYATVNQASAETMRGRLEMLNAHLRRVDELEMKIVFLESFYKKVVGAGMALVVLWSIFGTIVQQAFFRWWAGAK